MRWLVVVVALAACGGERSAPPPPRSGSGSAAVHAIDEAIDASSGSPLPAVVGKDGLPVVCGDWKAALDKLSTCTALSQRARESLQAVYADVSKDWGQLPADAKRNLVAICRAGADSVWNGAKATCGW